MSDMILQDEETCQQHTGDQDDYLRGRGTDMEVRVQACVISNTFTNNVIYIKPLNYAYSNMFKELQIIILVITILIAVIGLYFAFKAWSSWRHTDDEIIRARAFLTKSFLNKNFLLVFLTGAFMGLHTLLEFFEIFGYPSALMQYVQIFYNIYILTLTISLLLLVLLAYYWQKLLS
ncbi:MAG: hypothetical protein WC556_12605 [Candidatus Methanoperedens sp.]